MRSQGRGRQRYGRQRRCQQRYGKERGGGYDGFALIDLWPDRRCRAGRFGDASAG